MDHYPEDPWPTDRIIQHTSFLLTGSSTGSYAASPTALPLPLRTHAASPTPSHELSHMSASPVPSLPLPLQKPLHKPASPLSPQEQPASREAMFLGLAEEVSDTEDELDEEDRAALAHAYAQIEEVQHMIEVKRLAHVLPRTLPVLKLWVDEEALDLEEESAYTHDAGKLAPTKHADIIACATDSDVLLAPILHIRKPTLFLNV